MTSKVFTLIVHGERFLDLANAACTLHFMLFVTYSRKVILGKFNFSFCDLGFLGHILPFLDLGFASFSSSDQCELVIG